MKRVLLCALLLAACNREDKQQISNMTGGGDSAKGKQAIVKWGCTGCHNVPGVEGPKGMVGPPLDHMASRTVIAGKIQNTPPNMIQWIENPQSLDPNNAMPNLGVTAEDAKDIAAYLYTLK
jgi:cytochrome c1